MRSKKLPSMIVLMILTLLTVIFWVVFSVYRSYSKPLTVEISEEVILQINPNFDTKTIDNIKLRQ